MPQRKNNPRQNATVLLFVSQEDDSVENNPQDKEMLPSAGIVLQSLLQLFSSGCLLSSSHTG